MFSLITEWTDDDGSLDFGFLESHATSVAPDVEDAVAAARVQVLALIFSQIAAAAHRVLKWGFYRTNNVTKFQTASVKLKEVRQDFARIRAKL
jgi:hypothetical protein